MTTVARADDGPTLPGTTTRDDATERTSRLAIGLWAGFAALFLYAVLLGGSWIGIYALSLRLWTLAFIAVVLVGWAVVAWRIPDWRPRTSAWPLIVLPLGAFALAVATSRFPRLGLEYLAYAVLLFALYLLLVRILATPFARARIGALAATLGLVVGLVYLGIVVLLWIDWWGLVGHFEIPPLRPRFAGLTYGNPSAVLTVTALLTVIACAGLGFATRARRLTLIALTLVTALVAVATGSRAGWIGVGVALVVVGGAWLLLAARSGHLGRLLADRRVIGSIVAVVFVGIVVAAAIAPSVMSRVLSAGDGGRPVYFAAALRIFQDAPLLGTGPGTWAVLRQANTQPGELDWSVTHAHNIYLQTLSETGIVGALAGLAGLVAVGWLMWRAIQRADPEARRWAWATAFVLVMLGVHCLFDTYANMPAVLLLGILPVAWLDATSDRRMGIPAVGERGRSLIARAAAIGLFVLCGAAVVTLARSDAIVGSYESMTSLVDDGEWEAAERAIAPIVADDPDMPPYQVTRGLIASALGEWDEAADAFERAVTVDDLPQSWLGLAQARIELGAPDAEVVDALERAMRVGYQQAAVAYAAGSLYDRLGRTDEADEVYAAALVALPGLAADPSWREGALAPRFDGILDHAIDQLGRGGWELAMYANELDQARELAASSEDPRASLVIDAWAHDPEAVEELLDLAGATARDPALHGWAALVADREGDEDATERFRQLALFNWEGAELPGQRFGIAPGTGLDGLEGIPAGTRFAFYGGWLYRRYTPIDLTPPGLPRPIYLDLKRPVHVDDAPDPVR